MYYFQNQKQLEQFYYTNNLKKDMNKAGGFLLSMFVSMIIFTLIISLFTLSQILGINSSQSVIGNDSFLLLVNGLVSILSFFVVGFVYCKIAKIHFADILTFEKNKFSILVPLCAMGLAIALAANYASDAVIGVFDFFGHDPTVDMEYSVNNIYDTIIYYISIAVVPACVEEFAFRGIVLGCLRKYSDSLAIIVSSITFGIMHGNFMQIPFAFVVGLILGFVVVKTNSLLPAIIIHFLNNSISVTFTLLSQSNSLSSNTINIIYTGIMVLIAILGVISLAYLIKKHEGFFKLTSSDDIILFKEKVKVFCQSPTMIIFFIFMMLEAFSTIALGLY